MKYRPGSSNTTPPTVRDSNGNAYTVTPGGPAGVDWNTSDTGYVWLAYLLNAPGTASATITATFPATATFATIYVDEFHCSMAGTAFDKDGTAGSTSSAAVSGPSITPTSVGSLLHAYAAVGGTVGGANGPWTAGGASVDSNNGGEGEYVLSSASGATTASWNDTDNFDSMAMAFVPPSTFTGVSITGAATTGFALSYTGSGSITISGAATTSFTTNGFLRLLLLAAQCQSLALRLHQRRITMRFLPLVEASQFQVQLRLWLRCHTYRLAEQCCCSPAPLRPRKRTCTHSRPLVELSQYPVLRHIYLRSILGQWKHQRHWCRHNIRDK